MAGEPPPYDWVIPGLFERGDRLILTGPEGQGKSTMLRQIGVAAASGLHPFTLDQIDPVRVLYVDLENSERQLNRRYREMLVGKEIPSSFYLEIKSEGMNLEGEEDRAWLIAKLEAAQPDLLLIGPMYKLTNGDPNDEPAAKHAALTLDALRVHFDFALAIEAHTKHPQPGAAKPMAPYGASLWKRWPEFGYWLEPTPDNGGPSKLMQWRGPREDREWPKLVKRGLSWPWESVSGSDFTFAMALKECREAARLLPSIDISRRLRDQGHEVSTLDVERAMQSNRSQLEREFGRG